MFRTNGLFFNEAKKSAIGLKVAIVMAVENVKAAQAPGHLQADAVSHGSKLVVQAGDGNPAHLFMTGQ